MTPIKEPLPNITQYGQRLDTSPDTSDIQDLINSISPGNPIIIYQPVTSSGSGAQGSGSDSGSGDQESGKEGQDQGLERPKYCSNLAYQTGDFLENVVGPSFQDLGTGLVAGGAIVTATTWYTGGGTVAGGTIMTTGGTAYAFGTATSQVGNFLKFVGGQSSRLSGSRLLTIPTMRVGPIGQVISEKTISFMLNRGLKDPCK